VLWEKESSLNKKSTNQKIKFVLHLLICIVRPSWISIDLKFKLNIEKYVWNKILAQLMVKLRIILNRVKLDSRHKYTRIWIFSFNLFLDHIIISLFKMIRPRITNNYFKTSYLSIQSFFLVNTCLQQLCIKVAVILFHLLSFWHCCYSLSLDEYLTQVEKWDERQARYDIKTL
jgi:hypothetical protein